MVMRGGRVLEGLSARHHEIVAHETLFLTVVVIIGEHTCLNGSGGVRLSSKGTEVATQLVAADTQEVVPAVTIDVAQIEPVEVHADVAEPWHVGEANAVGLVGEHHRFTCTKVE